MHHTFPSKPILKALTQTWFLGVLSTLQTGCITVNMPKESDPKSWPSVHLYPDEESLQVINADVRSINFKHQKRQTSVSVISLCDRYLTDKTPTSLLESAKLSFPDAIPLELPSDLSTAFEKIPYAFERAYLKTPVSSQEVFILTLKSKACVDDIIVAGTTLQADDFLVAIELAQGLKEGIRKPGAQRFILNEPIALIITKDGR